MAVMTCSSKDTKKKEFNNLFKFIFFLKLIFFYKLKVLMAKQPAGRPPKAHRWDTELGAWVTLEGGEVRSPSKYVRGKVKKRDDMKDYSSLLKFPDLVDLNVDWAKTAVKLKYDVMCAEIADLEAQKNAAEEKLQKLEAQVVKEHILTDKTLANHRMFARNVLGLMRNHFGGGKNDYRAQERQARLKDIRERGISHFSKHPYLTVPEIKEIPAPKPSEAPEKE